MVFCVFIFLFRSNGKKKHLDENNFRHGYGNYFKSAVLKITLFQLSSTFFLKQLRGTLTTTFERYFTTEDFTDMDQHTS